MKVFKHSSQFTQELLYNRAFLERINVPIKVDCGWDIPYVSGYSTDGKTIYIDRHLKQFMIKDNKKIDITDFLVVHEAIEKAMIDLFRMHYRRAHHIATHFEYLTVNQQKINWWMYTKFLKSQTKTAYSEKLINIPRNLDICAIRDDEEKVIIFNIQHGSRINKSKQQEKIYHLDSNYFAKIENSDQAGYVDVDDYSDTNDYIQGLD